MTGLYIFLLSINLMPTSAASLRVVYIGTSKNGATRVAQSSADKGKKYLEDHGIRTLSAYIIAVPGKSKVTKIWKKLEDAMILAFIREYGAKPDANRQVPRGKTELVFKYFSEQDILRILRTLE